MVFFFVIGEIFVDVVFGEGWVDVECGYCGFDFFDLVL